MNGAKILAGITGSVWCITEAKLQQIVEVIEQRIEGGEPDVGAFLDIPEKSVADMRENFGPVAVLHLEGSIFPKANMVTKYSGGTSTQQFGTLFQEAMQDATVKTIVLNVDSPGGSVFGVEELGDTIYKARGQGKRIVAVANHMAASAAYWIATAADEMYVSPSGEIGSVGALMVHVDESRRMDKQGVKMTVIRAGENKARFNNVEPLEAETMAKFQAQVDRYRDMFVATIDRNRPGARMRSPVEYGAGDMFGAREAVANGMADGVASLESIIQREQQQGSRNSQLLRARAQVASAEISQEK